MLSRLVRIQLTLFAVITIVALTIMALNYVRIPAQLGVGRYEMSVELDHAGGLYPKSEVTYRGSAVGQVVSVDLREGGGAVATLQIEKDAKIPADSQALVRSASVIGEQYLNFVPPAGGTDKVFAEGDVVRADQTTLPTTTDEVLTSVDDLVRSVPTDDLTTTLDELGRAFDGTGDDLGALIDSGSELVAAANENLPQTVSLIESADTVLSTQIEMDPQIRALAQGLDVVTSELQTGDADLRKIFTESEPTVRAAQDFANQLTPVFGPVLSDVAAVGEVADAYLPAIEHLLIVYPAQETIFKSVLGPGDELAENPAINLWFKLGFDPPVCTEGFEGVNNFQDPNDPTVRPAYADTYCKVAQDSPLVPRGARNAPCPDGVSRGPRAADCGLVFDQVAVDQQSFLTNAGVSPTPAALAGSDLIAPTGRFFLTDQGSTAAIPESFADLLTGVLPR
ncbi:MlaD family protein [Aeromicrobium alkaliterrae]|uniref:MCE family protein n=1 Tax=Aeromicrobium alkaliterrae TaxID=302168 RepID=A0ABP4WBJ1_9ACTN